MRKIYSIAVLVIVAGTSFAAGALVVANTMTPPAAATTPFERTHELNHSFVPSAAMRRQCDGKDGQQGRAVCLAFLQGQIEVWSLLELEGYKRKCVSPKNDAEIAQLYEQLVPWISSEAGPALAGAPRSASSDISMALNSGNLCP